MEQPKMRSKKKRSSKSNSDSGSSIKKRHDDSTLVSNEEEEEQRRAKLVRSARKHEKKMAALGLDIHGEPLDNYSLEKYPVREWKFKFCGSTEPIAINPVVNAIGVLCLWSFVVWSMFDPDGSLQTLKAWHNQSVLHLSWLLQLSGAVSFFFVIYLMYKYGHVHLAQRPDEKPEFSFVTVVALLLASTVGPGLLVFGAVEPMQHSQTNFFAEAGYRSQDERDMFGINLAVFMWGIMSWTHIALVAIGLSLASHRFGLPVTFRSCFYPMLGAYTWGWIGDFIDGIAVVSAVVGACTSTTFACVQVVLCFVYLGWLSNTEEGIGLAIVVTIWIITVTSTASAISGLRGGVRFFSGTAFGLGILLTFLVVAMDDTKFILNLTVQEVGYHVQTSLFQLSFWTDAFGQLRAGSGRAIDDGASGELWYKKYSLLFFCAMLVCVVTGMLTAQLCRGRRVWEVCVATLLVPIAYTLIWFCSWGGVTARQSRQAHELEALGLEHFNNSEHFLVDGSTLCYDVPQQDLIVGNETIFTNHLTGITPVCQFDPADPVLHFNVLNVLNSFQFPQTFGQSGAGPALLVLFAVACAVNLTANSDSTSLMVDSLASNGRKNYHWMRRLFWASTVGALTIALLLLGGKSFQVAIQAMMVVAAVPILLLLCFLLHPTLEFCQAADKEQPSRRGGELEYSNGDKPEFAMPLCGGALNAIEYLVSLGKVDPARVERGMDLPTTFQVVELVKGFVAPFVPLSQVLNVLYPNSPRTNRTVVMVYTLCYVAWFGTFVASRHYPGLNGLMGAFLLATAGILGMARSSFRARHNLRSSLLADCLGSLFFWPQVLVQLRVQMCCADSRIPMRPSLKPESKSTRLDV